MKKAKNTFNSFAERFPIEINTIKLSSVKKNDIEKELISQFLLRTSNDEK